MVEIGINLVIHFIISLDKRCSKQPNNVIELFEICSGQTAGDVIVV